MQTERKKKENQMDSNFNTNFFNDDNSNNGPKGPTLNEEDFICAFTDRIRTTVTSHNPDFIVERTDTLKNNGRTLAGITVRDDSKKLSPNIYIEHYYEKYVKGWSLEALSNEFICDYDSIIKNLSFDNINMNEFLDRQMDDKIIMKMTNKSMNVDFSLKHPHLTFNDYLLTFYFVVDSKKSSISTIPIDYRLFNAIGYDSPNELFTIAKKNMQKMYPPRITTLKNVLNLCISDRPPFPDDDMPRFYQEDETEKYLNPEPIIDVINPEPSGVMHEFYLLSNCIGLNGATAMFYSDILKRFAKANYGDMIIIPSSIHELILVPMPTEKIPEHVKTLKEIMLDVNSEAVPHDQILGKDVMVYSEIKDELEKLIAL